MQKRKLYINLLNFSDNNISGTGYFMKRLFLQSSIDGLSFKPYTEVIVLSSEHVDAQSLFSIPIEEKIRIVKVKLGSGTFRRIVYEQICLPFMIARNAVYFSPTPVIPYFAAMIRLGRKFVCTVHDLIPFFVKKYSPVQRTYIKIISYLSSKISNKVITVSESTRSDIVNLFKVPISKIQVIYNFFPQQKLQPEHSDHSFFVTVATLELGKNLENTIKAFALFLSKKRNKNIKYYIIGKKGYGHEVIMNLCGELQLQDSLYFLGYLTEGEKNNYLQNSSAHIYISLYEGFGLPVLEAMYFDKPSLTSNISSLPEVVGNAGLCVNPNNIEDIAEKMEEILANKSIYQANIPNQIEKFNPTTTTRDFFNIINSYA